MSKLYKKLQIALTSYEDRPIETVIKQKFTESLYIIRGKDQGLPAWHYILVPIENVPGLKNQLPGETIDITKFGRLVIYKTKVYNDKQASGWGTDPPQMFKTWIEDQYDAASVDESIDLKYTKDDIRLCTMQRAISEQKLGVQFNYHRQEEFHYLKLTEDLQSSLARRAGLKKYDRIISINGISVQDQTFNEFMQIFDSEKDLPTQMLVCSPATYQFYKEQKRLIHIKLSTVKIIKPVFASSISNSDTDQPEIYFDKNQFYAIQWDKTNTISIVPQSAVFKAPQFTQINDICFIEKHQQYQRGKIIFKGSYNDCKKFKSTIVSSVTNSLVNTFTNLFSKKTHSYLKTSNKKTQLTILEDLPDELFFYIFNHIDTDQLFNSFWGLNQRLNRLFKFCQNFSLIYTDETDKSLILFYSQYLNRIIIDTSKEINFNEFPNVHKLILANKHEKHLKIIHSNYFSRLTHLTVLLGSDFILEKELIYEIFSNKFPLLIHADLGQINILPDNSLIYCPSLKFLSIRINKIEILISILYTCPNLYHLQLHIMNINVCKFNFVYPLNHFLHRLTLWTDKILLNYENLQRILSYTNNVQHLYLQTECEISLIDLCKCCIDQFRYLYRFDCYIKYLNRNQQNQIENVSLLHEIHPSFNRIKSIEEKEDFRIFATD